MLHICTHHSPENMEFDVLDMISKDLGSGGKRLPTVGYQLTSDNADLLEHVLSVGYRHFLFPPAHTRVLADTLQEYAGDEDIFLTLRVPVYTDKHEGAQHSVLHALSTLGLEAIDMVLLYENQAEETEDKQERGYIWNSRWMELEALQEQGLVKNIGLYSDSAEDVQRVGTRAKTKPAIVIVPGVELQRGPAHPHRYDVVAICKKLGCRVGVALNNDFPNGPKAQLCSSQTLCRTMVEEGFSYVVSSQNDGTIVGASQVFDQWVATKQQRGILKALGFRL